MSDLRRNRRKGRTNERLGQLVKVGTNSAGETIYLNLLTQKTKRATRQKHTGTGRIPIGVFGRHIKPYPEPELGRIAVKDVIKEGERMRKQRLILNQ